jgi:hypothetical protein
MLIWRTQLSERTGEQEKAGSSFAARDGRCCPVPRSSSLRAVVPGACTGIGTVITIALLPKCPLCWIALMAAIYAGWRIGTFACIAVVSLAVVIVWYRKSSSGVS